MSRSRRPRSVQTSGRTSGSLTAGGKRVEGRLKRLDGADVVMLVFRDGGTAEMRIPAAGIRGAESPPHGITRIPRP